MAPSPSPAPAPEPKRHDWHFMAAETVSGRTVIPAAIAVCRECGLIRTEIAVAQREGRIDLRGDCPGR